MLGQVIQHYEVEARLGQGGMGVVYRARDTRLGRAVAIKFLPPEFSTDPDRKRRFEDEARAACAVNHPAIAQVYDVGEHTGQLFIVMELVEGKTVRALLQARELDLLGAVEIAAQVGEGLARAHEAGVVHRDVKADNVVVTPDGHAKLLDFGLAKRHELAAPSGADPISQLETVARTQAGVVLGTLHYMSPEQARGQSVDARSDIFSLGVLLYEMVTGQLPFSGRSPVDMLHAIAFEESRPVTQVRANLPPNLQRVVSRCLRKRPEDRYAEARALVGDLRALQREIETGVSRPQPLREKLDELWRRWLPDPGGRAWLVPALGAGGVLLLGGLLVGLAYTDRLPIAGLMVGLGVFEWRRWRNRSRRLLSGFVKSIKGMEEVRAVTATGQRVTVVVDRRLARTYLRAHTLIDAVNARLFFGQPFTVEVRDDLSPEETRALFGSGLLYVRRDVLDVEV
jgi:predicted Ser/Thr protein kinase